GSWFIEPRTQNLEPGTENCLLDREKCESDGNRDERSAFAVDRVSPREHTGCRRRSSDCARPIDAKFWQPPWNALHVTAVRIAPPLGQQRLLPWDDRVVLEHQQEQDDRHEPQQMGADRKSEPEQDVAQVKGVSHERKRSGRDERAESVAPGAGNSA